MSPTRYYPIGVDLTAKTVLVVGAGNVAVRKLKRLVAHACHLVVLSAKASELFIDLAKQLGLEPDNTVDHNDFPEKITMNNEALPVNLLSIKLIRNWYHFSVLDDTQPHLVLACTDDPQVNQLIVNHCQRLGILVNSATHNHFNGDAIIPSVIEEGTAESLVQIAISASGQNPGLIKWLNKHLKTLLGKTLQHIAQNSTQLRQHLHANETCAETRQQVMKQLFAQPQLLAAISQSDYDETQLAALLKQLKPETVTTP